MASAVRLEGITKRFPGVIANDGVNLDVADGEIDVDFSTLLTAGIEGEYVLHRGWVHIGVNPGGSVAWKGDDVRFSGTAGGSGAAVGVTLDNSMLLAEIHLGGYVRGRLHDRVTAYAAAGPMLMYGHHEVQDEYVNGSEQSVGLTEDSGDDFNFGYYARAGIDFEVAARALRIASCRLRLVAGQESGKVGGRDGDAR